MPDLARHLTEDEYETRLDTQIRDVVREIILSDERYGIDKITIGEIAMDTIELYGPIWDDATSESIAEHADSESFDPHEQLTLSSPADIIIVDIAYNTLHATIVDKLDGKIEQLNKAQMIHLFLKERLKSPEPEQPSAVLDEFNRWLVITFSEQKILKSTYDYEDFNEQHIRGLQAIEIDDTKFINHLYDWLEDTCDDFPEVVHA